MNDNIHAFPTWWAIFLFILGTILVFLPLSEVIQYLNGESNLALLFWAILQFGLSFGAFGWGADILYYRDKNIRD